MIDEKKLIEYLRDKKYQLVISIREEEILDSVIKVIDEQPKVGEWISVKDRLPDEFELVLIQNIYGVMSVASRIKDRWFNFQGTELCEAIAWMPLPEPYKGDD